MGCHRARIARVRTVPSVWRMEKGGTATAPHTTRGATVKAGNVTPTPAITAAHAW